MCLPRRCVTKHSAHQDEQTTAASAAPLAEPLAAPATPCRFTPRRVPLLRDETESMTNPTRRIRAHGRLFSSHGNRTRDQLRDPRAVEKVTLVNRKLIPPRCLTAWCFRRSMDKRGHWLLGADHWVVGPTRVGRLHGAFPPPWAQSANEHELGRLSGLCMRGSVSA